VYASVSVSCLIMVLVGIWCRTGLLRRRYEVGVEPTTFGRASFMGWYGSSHSHIAVVFDASCLSPSHSRFTTVATCSCALIHAVCHCHMWYSWLERDLGWLHLQAPSPGANPRHFPLVEIGTRLESTRFHRHHSCESLGSFAEPVGQQSDAKAALAW
jgi:hypothetical protein